MKIILAIFVVSALVSRAADWPQRQGNPQRTGYTTDAPKPPFKLVWSHYFPDDNEKVHPQVQPIVYQGKVFAGTKMGSMRCFDAATGAQLWKWADAKGPVLNTAACDDGKVVFSCLDGYVRALDVNDGRLLWAFDGGMHGFNTAPCVAAGRVFIGARSGVFYCLDIKDGKLLWRMDAGAPIYNTAAYNDGRVFFGSENMIVHCLDSATGAETWKSERVGGISFSYYHPVVSSGKVVIRSYGVTTLPVLPKFDLEQLKAATAGGEFLKVPDHINDSVQEYFSATPSGMNFHVFDEKTGKRPYVPVHGTAGTNEGFAAPPCVDGQGRWVFAWGSDGPLTWMVFVRMNPATGRLQDFVWLPEERGAYKCRANDDEQQDFSVGGDILFVSQGEEGEAGYWGAFDLKTARGYSIPTSLGHMQGLQYNAQMQGGNPFAIVGRRLYHIAFHNMACWEGAEEK